MPAYKLHYFPIGGRAEPARIMFHMAGVEFEDIRIPMAEWPKHKPTMPWGSVPVLDVEGKGRLGQSASIYQYLAKEFGFNGESDFEAAQIQEYLGSVDDMFFALSPIFREKDAEKKKELVAKAISETIEPYFTKLEKRLADNDGEHFVGKKLTVADLVFYVVFGMTQKMFAPDIFTKFAKLGAFVSKMGDNPKIKEWNSIRPADVPF